MASFSNDTDPKIIDLILAHSEKEPWRALEFFPPRTPQGVDNLKSRIPRMTAEAKPLYVDITWGAGGTTRYIGWKIFCLFYRGCWCCRRAKIQCTPFKCVSYS